MAKRINTVAPVIPTAVATIDVADYGRRLGLAEKAGKTIAGFGFDVSKALALAGVGADEATVERLTDAYHGGWLDGRGADPAKDSSKNRKKEAKAVIELGSIKLAGGKTGADFLATLFELTNTDETYVNLRGENKTRKVLRGGGREAGYKASLWLEKRVAAKNTAFPSGEEIVACARHCSPKDKDLNGHAKAIGTACTNYTLAVHRDGEMDNLPADVKAAMVTLIAHAKAEYWTEAEEAEGNGIDVAAILAGLAK
jgi:hypothetical protein